MSIDNAQTRGAEDAEAHRHNLDRMTGQPVVSREHQADRPSVDRHTLQVGPKDGRYWDRIGRLHSLAAQRAVQHQRQANACLLQL